MRLYCMLYILAPTRRSGIDAERSLRQGAIAGSVDSSSQLSFFVQQLGYESSVSIVLLLFSTYRRIFFKVRLFLLFLIGIA